jgi:chromosome segregation ATPase
VGLIADILKEIPSAARYKAELKEMERENSELKSKIVVLEAQIVDLRQEIDRRDNVIQDKESHANALDNGKELIFKSIVSGNNAEEDIIKITGFSAQKLMFHVEDQRMSTLVNRKNIGGLVTVYGITPKGREYCALHNLI